MKQIPSQNASRRSITELSSKFIFLTFSLCFTLLFSCNKTELVEPENEFADIENASIEKQREFLTHNFKLILKDIAPAFKNPAFRSFVINEMEKKFDGEAHILISSIAENSQFDNLINKNSLRKTLSNFKNIAGENLYPQLYLPNFDKFYGGPRIETEENAEFVYYDGNDSKTVSRVYYVNEDGEVIDKGYNADETYARNNEVFVVSINESVNNDGGIPVQDTLRPIEITYNPDDSVPTIESIINVRIKEITIKDSKESWLAGDSEVNIKAWLSTWNGRANGTTTGQQISYSSIRAANNYQGFEIVKARRSNITSGIGDIYVNLNYPLQTNWDDANYYTNPIAYTYVIFEYDKWPAAIENSVSILQTGPSTQEQKNITFRSSNSAYGGMNVPQYAGNSNISYAMYANITGLPSGLQTPLNVNNYTINTSDIFFKTQKY